MPHHTPSRTPLGTRDERRAESIASRDGWFPAPTPDLPAEAPPGAVRVYLRRCWRTGDGLARALLVRGEDGFLWLADLAAAPRPGRRPARRRLFAAGRRHGGRADR